MTPRISVLIAAVHGGRLSDCLESLRSQVSPEVEVIVAGQRGFLRQMESFDWARLVEVDEPPTVPHLLGAAIKVSKGETIAITDSSCVVAENWLASIDRAHHLAPEAASNEHNTIIGGTVEIDGSPGPLEWAGYLCEYGQFMQPLIAGPANEIPGNNLTFRRKALKHATHYVQPQFWKSYWSEEMRKLGSQIVAWPEMVVRQEKHYEPGAFLVRRFNHGRCFAGMRFSHASVLLRIAYGAGAVLLPFILVARVIATILRKRRYLRQFCLSFHYVLLAILAWSAGELCGYLSGTGKSCSRLW